MRRAVTAAMIGNATEWYDYAIYGYLAVTLGGVFFPSDDPTVSLLASFSAFALAFLIRPLGAFFFGPLSDKIGRQRSLSITILVMAGATFAIGLLPGYATAGVFAPIALVVLRLVQGFAVGGEYGGASTFAVEYAPDKRRGMWASWLEFGAIAGFLLASGLVALLTVYLPHDAMVTWGWRVPFLIAGPLGSIGLYLRMKLVDTPSFRALEDNEEVARAPVRDTLTNHWRHVLICIGIVMYSSIGTYTILTFMPSYFSETLKTGAGSAQLLVFAAGALLTIGIPAAGILSDRVGRKPLLVAAALGYAVLAYPAFWLMSLGSMPGLLSGVLLLTLCQIPILGTTTAVLPALFPTRVRGTGVSIGYNVSHAIFGGTAPLLATFLVDRTGSSFAPAFYLIAVSLVALIPVLMSPETAGRPLREE
ncbi:MHS family proline/betaine transporter-like MFS transporter [Murinocardiopsis flavida]|uniref:Putative proline/betaine transporter n=2 Tax=Murinocardiopsis flavida TaxID=645275 RepID=A0A2P8CJ60_9ACTN|nr:MHS family proline/betaine transporter-like MFS transporter [Murinocardiopsis flavida]